MQFMILFSLFFIILNVHFVQSPGFLTHDLHEQLTGEEAVSDSTLYDVNGTDLGIIVKHTGKYYYIFGDTFGCGYYLGTNWRSNTIAYSTDSDPSDGITLDGWILDPPTGYAKELISSAKIDYVEMTCIPTTAISLDGNIYIYYMSVSHWGFIGGNWDCNNASIAVSIDNGQTFTKMDNISWSGDSNFVQFGVAQKSDSLTPEEYIYLLATPSGRFGACYLCRVPHEDILDKSGYEYFSGLDVAENPIWVSNELDADTIFSSPVGELSVMWNEFLNKWTVYYFDNTQFAIVVRSADNLWGPWSSTQKIVGAIEYPSLYGSFVHPDLIENNGQTVYFVMSIFSVYNTFIMSVDLTPLTATNTINSPNFSLFIIGFSSIFGVLVILKNYKKKS
ncbi:MAG: DUF4185 domain-containing protein [Asgard group archaeon]|nr:DUF4185 domain-containing protein [Asgard group archaeon]